MDLFAGPGVNVPATGGPEFESGALRVLRAHGVRYPGLTFSDAVLVNIDPLDCAALEARVDRLVASGECLIPRHRIQVICRDSNLAIADILSRFHQRDYVWAPRFRGL